MSGKTPKTAVSLLLVVIQKRDELLRQINSKKVYQVKAGRPEEHSLLRAEAYNDGLEDAMRIVREVL